MNTKLVTLPLSPADMVEFFKNKEQHYEIDVETTLQDMTERSMLLYLSNLGIRCSFSFVTPALMREYMVMKDFVEAPMLMAIHANILLFLKYHSFGYPAAEEYFDEEDTISFIEENQDLVIVQAMFLDSFLLYIETRRDESIEHVTEDDALYDELGFSVLKLLQYEDFMIIFSLEVPELEEQTYFTKYFDDYMFKGKNLFHYAASSPMFGMVKLIHDKVDEQAA